MYDTNISGNYYNIHTTFANSVSWKVVLHQVLNQIIRSMLRIYSLFKQNTESKFIIHQRMHKWLS